MNRKIRNAFAAWIVIISFILTPAKVWGEAVQSAENSSEKSFIEAPAAVLMEKETGTVIYSRDPDTRRSPASITKIMTLILIFDALENGKLHLDDTITTSAYAESMGGSQVFLEEGETQKAETMIKCIVIASGNDASVAMAEHLAGTEQAFVEQMNKRASELGMKNTHFTDCCGLTESREHYTTAYDIALMSRELISKYPEILTYSAIWMEDITHITRKGSSKFTLTNTNKLLRSYEGCMGLKTGSTSIAKYCLSAVAERNGITLIASVMAAPDPKTRFRDAASLLNYGFSKCILYLDEALEELPSVKVRKGLKEEVSLTYAGKFRYLSTDGTKPDNIKKKRILSQKTTAPVKKGEKAGIQEYYQNGKRIGTLDILYAETVEKARYRDWAGRVAKAFLL